MSCALSGLGRFLAAVLITSLPALVGITHASVEPPEVDSCIARLDPQLDIGYDRIAVRCPELFRKLEQGPWSAWLPRGWNEPGNDLSAGGLKELRRLIALESGARLSGSAPDVGRLPVVINHLTDTSSVGTWARFKHWLRSILERRDEPAGDSWFSRLASHIGIAQTVRQTVAYGALALVVLLAATIIGNELRASGLIPSRSAARRSSRTPRPGRVSGGIDDMQGLPYLERPRFLLERVLSRLNERGVLPAPGALTVRELMSSARLAVPADRDRLSNLALTAERVRYSGGTPGTAEIDGPVSGGRVLLNRLEAGSL
jgi:hypothetical protein